MSSNLINTVTFTVETVNGTTYIDTDKGKQYTAPTGSEGIAIVASVLHTMMSFLCKQKAEGRKFKFTLEEIA